jgi:hypothetical protein
MAFAIVSTSEGPVCGSPAPITNGPVIVFMDKASLDEVCVIGRMSSSRLLTSAAPGPSKMFP